MSNCLLLRISSIRVTFLILIAPPKKTNSQIRGTDASSLSGSLLLRHSDVAVSEQSKVSSALSVYKDGKLSKKLTEFLNPPYCALDHTLLIYECKEIMRCQSNRPFSHSSPLLSSQNLVGRRVLTIICNVLRKRGCGFIAGWWSLSVSCLEGYGG